jgi:hypothetical protein
LGKLLHEDLTNTNPILNEGDARRLFVWLVYDGYEQIEEDGRLPYLKASNRDAFKIYDPIFHTPHLFLDFARIAESKSPPDELAKWLRQYGLLGLSCDGGAYGVPHMPQVVSPPLCYSPEGGPGETRAAIWEEVRTANEVLGLYEAVFNQDDGKLEDWHLRTYEDPEQRWLQTYTEETDSTRVDTLAGLALIRVQELVRERLMLFAYPDISLKGTGAVLQGTKGSVPSVEQLALGWSPRNLLGAIYLQFYWLITSGKDLSRCKQCGRIISYAPPMPKWGELTPRKPRRDKEFCNRQCRQNYHYHNVVKPRKQGKRA